MGNRNASQAASQAWGGMGGQAVGVHEVTGLGSPLFCKFQMRNIMFSFGFIMAIFPPYPN